MSNDEGRGRVLQHAASYKGTPYAMPPSPPHSLDCSLYVIHVFRDAKLPFKPGVRTAEQLRQQCDPFNGPVLKGDLVFFEGTYDASENPGPDDRLATHIGISLGSGSGRMWDANDVNGVSLTNITTPYWQEHWLEARRPRQYGDTIVIPPEDEEPQTGMLRVTGAHVRLRSEGSVKGTILAILNEEASVAPLDEYSWRKIRTSDGKEGWIAADFLEPAS